VTEGFLIWVGEEDHLRIMAMRKGKTLNKVFDRLRVSSYVTLLSATRVQISDERFG
jgi:protein-arginine kinase